MLEEFRHGRLSEPNYNFLHGLPTKEPGSCVDGEVLCGNAACCAIARKPDDAMAAADLTQLVARERRRCRTCADERQSKALVVDGIRDQRLGFS